MSDRSRNDKLDVAQRNHEWHRRSTSPRPEAAMTNRPGCVSCSLRTAGPRLSTRSPSSEPVHKTDRHAAPALGVLRTFSGESTTSELEDKQEANGAGSGIHLRSRSKRIKQVRSSPSHASPSVV